MVSTTNPHFGHDTEAVEVAKAFSDGIKDKTFLLTGINLGGLAFSAAQAIASQSPLRLIVSGRNPEKLDRSIDNLKAEFPDIEYRRLVADLSDQESVRIAATEALSWSDVPSIDFMINGAGIMGTQERTLSKDGLELHFASNYVGHWLLTNLLMPKIIKAAHGQPKGTVRIVNISAGAAMFSNIRWSDMNFEMKNKCLPEKQQPKEDFMQAWGYKDVAEASYIPMDAYVRSKVGNILYGIAANKRLFDKHGILSLALHPGVISTDMFKAFSPVLLKSIHELAGKGWITFKTPEAGSSTTLVAALDPKLAVGVGETIEGRENWGSYLSDCQISTQASPDAMSSDEAEKLWEYTEKLVGQAFSW